jgi:hypothetical protein
LAVATAAPAAAAAAGFAVVVVRVVAGSVSVVAGRVSVVTGRVWVSVRVTVLEGRVWVSAGRVSVTVTGGLAAGASVVVWIGTVVCVAAWVGGVVVAVVRVRPGSVDVIAVEGLPLPPLPHPAVASATITPRSPAVA